MSGRVNFGGFYDPIAKNSYYTPTINGYSPGVIQDDIESARRIAASKGIPFDPETINNSRGARDHYLRSSGTPSYPSAGERRGSFSSPTAVASRPAAPSSTAATSGATPGYEFRNGVLYQNGVAGTQDRTTGAWSFTAPPAPAEETAPAVASNPSEPQYDSNDVIWARALRNAEELNGLNADLPATAES